VPIGRESISWVWTDAGAGDTIEAKADIFPDAVKGSVPRDPNTVRGRNPKVVCRETSLGRAGGPTAMTDAGRQHASADGQELERLTVLAFGAVIILGGLNGIAAKQISASWSRSGAV
jgi:hypothetical protein